jgi:hypothetical protein
MHGHSSGVHAADIPKQSRRGSRTHSQEYAVTPSRAGTATHSLYALRIVRCFESGRPLLFQTVPRPVGFAAPLGRARGVTDCMGPCVVWCESLVTIAGSKPGSAMASNNGGRGVTSGPGAACPSVVAPFSSIRPSSWFLGHIRSLWRSSRFAAGHPPSDHHVMTVAV